VTQIETTAGERMVLYPVDPYYVPEARDTFLQALIQRGLLGAHWRDDRYLVGQRFMQEIVFIGCAPFLRVDPQDDLQFCHLQVFATEEAIFRRSPQAGAPRCPQCRVALISNAVADLEMCPQCHRKMALQDCAWRAGRTVWSRFGINIWTLQKGDAQATDSLLDFLQRLSDVKWKTAFL